MGLPFLQICNVAFSAIYPLHNSVLPMDGEHTSGAKHITSLNAVLASEDDILGDPMAEVHQITFKSYDVTCDTEALHT